ncbi:hypothetical protein [Pedobacter sp. KBW01]|uniref:hypothetical protein n=1 Tax=Pedobacter sp. KBW01 TaxID=2153364 RepID=UPI000F5B5BD2|nr:hypothetical protein [Pedobacter sp. KBW01]
MTNPTKKRRISRMIMITICLIAISNTPPVQFFTLDNYHYQNADKSFSYTEFPGKGLDFETGMIRWNRFLKAHPNTPHSTLYRTFSINPLKFWEWWQLIAHTQRYRLAYISPQKP